MEMRHFFEARQQREALKEFNNLQVMKELVDWDLFTPTLRRSSVLLLPVVRDDGPGITLSSSVPCWWRYVRRVTVVFRPTAPSVRKTVLRMWLGWECILVSITRRKGGGDTVE